MMLETAASDDTYPISVSDGFLHYCINRLVLNDCILFLCACTVHTVAQHGHKSTARWL